MSDRSRPPVVLVVGVDFASGLFVGPLENHDVKLSARFYEATAVVVVPQYPTALLLAAIGLDFVRCNRVAEQAKVSELVFEGFLVNIDRADIL